MKNARKINILLIAIVVLVVLCVNYSITSYKTSNKDMISYEYEVIRVDQSLVYGQNEANNTNISFILDKLNGQDVEVGDSVEIYFDDVRQDGIVKVEVAK